jgi:serine/threonine protein kinase
MPALSPDHWRALSPYLDQALDIAPEKRAAWLESLREQNPDLARDLQTLLKEHHEIGDEGFLQGGAATHPSLLPLAGQAVGAYTLESPIGQGGMGTVWVARRSDGRFEGHAAVKFLNVAFLGGAGEERFKREGSFLARLAHPNIAHLLDAGVSASGQPYLVLEYIEGNHIDKYCNEHALDIEARIHLFLDVLAAVAHAHANLIVHRDIKPSNVLVTGDGHVKLLDFGIAKLIEDEAAATVLTREGERALTLAYAAPEQVTGNAITTGTDVYALGVLLYLLLAGKHPAESALQSPAGLVKFITDTEPPRPSDVVGSTHKLRRVLRGDLDTIIAKALKKNPVERYASVTAFAEDLRRYLGYQTISARPDSLAYRARKFVRRYRVPVAAAALVIASLSAGLYLANRERAIAQRRFMEVRQLANKLFDIDVLARELPGSTKTRQLIVDTSLDYLRRLAADVRGDHELALEVGNAYMRVARVQGLPSSTNLGQMDQAEENLQIAERFIHSVLVSQPANRTALVRSAQISHDQMALARFRGQHDEALAFARKSAAQLAKFPAKGIDRSEAPAVLFTYLNVADQHMLGQQFDDALRLCSRAIEIARSFNSRSYLGDFLSVRARVFQAQGDLDQALRDIDESVKLLDPGPGNTEQGRTLNFILVLIYQSRILGQDSGVSFGRSEEAVAPLERAFTIADGFVHQDPNDQASRNRLAMAGIELAHLLRHSDAPRALTVYDHSLRHLAEVTNNVILQRSEVQALAGSSYPLRALGRPGEVRQRLDASFERLRQLKMYPAEKIKAGSEADDALSALADYQAETGNVVRAIEVYQELIDRVGAASPKPDTILQDAVHLSRIYAAKAVLHRRAGQADLASALEARTLELWRHWERQLPKNPFVLRQLAAKPTANR